MEEDDDHEFLTFAEATAMLADGETVHVISQCEPGVLVGADWRRADILRLLREGRPEVSGSNAASHGHKLCVFSKGRWLFIATKAGAQAPALDAETVVIRGERYTIDELVAKCDVRRDVGYFLLRAILGHYDGSDFSPHRAKLLLKRQLDHLMARLFPDEVTADAERRRENPDRYKTVPIGVRLAVFERDGYRCRRCGLQADLSIDHIKPRSKGGTSDPENLQTICKPCNLKKRDWYPAPNPHASNGQ